jgi:N-methylhydantoinase A
MTLVPFGGAGPLFTCRLAASLGMRRAVVPPHPGVLSALGLAAAPARVEHVRSVHRPAHDIAATEWDALCAPVAAVVSAELPGSVLQRVADCRYPGQGYELGVAADGGPAAAAAAFHALHAERFGHADRERAVEIVNVRVVGTRRAAAVRIGEVARGAGAPAPGTRVAGPATIPLEDATVRIEQGWTGGVHATGALIVKRDGPDA